MALVRSYSGFFLRSSAVISLFMFSILTAWMLFKERNELTNLNFQDLKSDDYDLIFKFIVWLIEIFILTATTIFIANRSSSTFLIRVSKGFFLFSLIGSNLWTVMELVLIYKRKIDEDLQKELVKLAIQTVLEMLAFFGSRISDRYIKKVKGLEGTEGRTHHDILNNRQTNSGRLRFSNFHDLENHESVFRNPRIKRPYA